MIAPYAEISNRALHFGMTEQELERFVDAGSSVGTRHSTKNWAADNRHILLVLGVGTMPYDGSERFTIGKLPISVHL